MKNYETKRDYLMGVQGWWCPICKYDINTQEKIDLHHTLHNTKPNRKKFPLLIHSIFNLQLVHHSCNTGNWGKSKANSFNNMPVLMAEQLEYYLEQRPYMAEWANNPT